MALLQAEQAFCAVEVSLRNKPTELLALSPKGTVPVLQLIDGTVLEESWDIMRWAWSNDDAEACWSSAQMPENLDLLRSNDGEFKRHLDRYKYPDRHPDETRSRDIVRASAVALLLPLEKRLGAQPYLGGATPCATDLAIFPFVRQFAGVEPAWFAGLPLPALQSWLAGWLESRLFDVCMTRLPPQSGGVYPELHP